MRTSAISLAVILALSGCGGGMGFGSGGLFGGVGADRSPASAAMPPGTDTIRPEARPGSETSDGTTAAGGDQVLGLTVASLGDASRPGMWLETPLVSAEGPGRVVGPDGRTVAVTLRPTGGAEGSGSRLSLQAMQGLGLDLTSLPTVTVISDA